MTITWETYPGNNLVHSLNYNAITTQVKCETSRLRLDPCRIEAGVGNFQTQLTTCRFHAKTCSLYRHIAQYFFFPCIILDHFKTYLPGILIRTVMTMFQVRHRTITSAAICNGLSAHASISEQGMLGEKFAIAALGGGTGAI